MGPMDRYNEKKKKQQETASDKTSSSGPMQRYETQKYYSQFDTSAVNDAYIDAFYNDWKNFASSAEKDYDSLGWGNASSLYDSRNATWKDLSARADILAAYYYKNRNNFKDADGYASMVNDLNEIRSSASNILKAFQTEADYYSKFATEDEFNEWNKYSYIPEASDFAEKSKYVSTYRGGEKYNDFSNMYTDTGYDDIMYDYINRDENARQIKAVNNISNNSSFFGFDKSERREMTDEEISIFNYIYATQGKDAAYEYVDHITAGPVGLNARQREKETEAWESYAKESPVGSSIFSVLEAPLKGLSYIGQAADYLDDGKIDQNAGYNKFSYINSAIRNQVTQDVEKNWGGVGSFAYQTGMSMADFLFTTAVSGGNSALSLGIMGTGAAADTVIYAKDRGLSDTQAFALGTIAGAAEIVTEKISLDALLDATQLGKNALGYIAQNIIAEGTEEVTSSAINLIADVLISRDKSEWQEAINAYKAVGMSDNEAFWHAVGDQALSLGLDFLGGAVSGGVMGGGGVALNAINTAVNTADQGSEFKGFGADLTHEALEINPENRYAQKMQGKLDSGKTLSDYQLGKLVQQNESALVSQDKAKIKSAVEARLTALGETGDVARLADIITKAQTEGNLTRSERAILTESKYGRRVSTELNPNVTASGNYSSEWTGNLGTNRIGADVYNRSAPTEAAETAVTTEAEQAEAVSVGENEGAEVNAPVSENTAPAVADHQAATATMLGDDGDEVSVTPVKFTEIENGAATIELEGGQTVKADSVAFKNSGVGFVYQAATEMASGVGGFNVDAANVMVRGVSPDISEEDASLYVAAFNEAYRYGAMGYPSSALETRWSSAFLSEKQRETAYSLGKIYGEGKVSAKQANIDRAKAESAGKPRKKGKVYFDGSAVGKNLTERQRASLKGLRVVAEAMGVDIHIFQSEVVDNVRQGANGWYDPSTKEIHLDLHAGIDGNGLMLYTASHELTHHIKNVSPAKFKAFSDALLEEYTKNGQSIDRLVASKLEFLDKKGRTDGLTEEQAYDLALEEVVADACEAMLVDSGAIEIFSRKIKSKDKSLWETIKEFIDKLVARIRAAYEGVDPDSVEGKLTREMKDSAERLQKLWVEAALDAAEAYPEVAEALGKGASLEVNEKGDFTVGQTKDGTLLYNDRTYEEGGRETLEKTLREEGFSEDDIWAALVIMDAKHDLVKRLGEEFVAQGEVNRATLVTDVKHGHSALSALVKNGDYPVNIDLSTVCKKRQAYQRVINRLCESGLIKQATLDSLAIAEINKILGKYGFETACLGCFVESKRLRIQEYAQTVCKEWNSLVEKKVGKENAKDFGFAKDTFVTDLTDEEIDRLTEEYEKAVTKEGNVNVGTGSYLKKFEKLMDSVPSLQKRLTVSDIATPKGMANLKSVSPELFALVASRYGSGTPKPVQSFNPYNSELAVYGSKPKKYASLREYLYAIGGARMQSFSDFIVENWFDYCQIVADLTARKLPMHTYTKEITLAKLFGMTGIKVNMSLIPDIDTSLGSEYAGLTKNANGEYELIWSDKDRFKATGGKSYMQSINFADAVALQSDPRYSANVGTIAIGISDNHIRVMLDDSRIRMIIPYHKSNINPIFAKLSGIDYYKDYTDVQSTTVKELYDSNGKKADLKLTKKQKEDITAGFEFNEALQRLGDARAAAQEYIEWCADSSLHTITIGGETYTATLTPKFEAFSEHTNYYKLLEDFNTYDNITEQAAPQGDVQQIYPEDFEQILRDELKAREKYSKKQEPKWETAMGEIEDYLKTHTKAETKAYAKANNLKLKFSDRVTDKETLDFLNDQLKKGEVTKVYRAMQVQPVDESGNVIKATVLRVVSQSPLMVEAKTFGKNGKTDIYPAKLFSPMAGMVNGKWSKNIELNQWEETSFDLAHATTVIDEKTGKPKIDTDKKNASYGETAYFYGLVKGGIDNSGKKLTPVPARYNPYIHTSLSALNDQFSSANKRPELVTVECIVPNSELTSGFRAEGAKDRVGAMSWHSGPTSSRLAQVGKARTVILTRYDMPIRVLPDSEVAQAVADYIGDSENIAIKESTVTPSLSTELRNLGVSVLNEEEWAQYDKDFPTKTFGKNNKKSNDVRYSDRDSYAPVFYSHMGKVIDDVKLEKMGSASILNHLKNRGVKAEEIKWSGIEAFLEGKKSVTKAELQEFVAGSQLQIEEENWTGGANISLEPSLFGDDSWELMLGGEVLDTYSWNEDSELYESDTTGGGFKTKERLLEYFKEKYGPGNTRWSRYKLSGGENYRELVFRMPNATHTNPAMRMHWGQDAEGILVHARIQDFVTPDGKQMLFVEEIQSDWHNEGAKDGYLEKDDIERIERLKAKAEEAFFSVEDYSTEMTGSAGEWDTIKKTEKGAQLLGAYREAQGAYDNAMNVVVQKVPDAPFRTNYHEYVMKRLLRMAAEDGYDSIGWTPADIQSKRWSEEYAEAYRIEYDQDIPKFLRKYGKKWGATVGKTSVGGTDVWSMDITDSMKDSVLYEGQVLYSDRDTSYMEAVKRGDMETAQKMVDEAAKEAGYTTMVYHGTPNTNKEVNPNWGNAVISIHQLLLPNAKPLVPESRDFYNFDHLLRYRFGTIKKEIREKIPLNLLRVARQGPFRNFTSFSDKYAGMSTKTYDSKDGFFVTENADFAASFKATYEYDPFLDETRKTSVGDGTLYKLYLRPDHTTEYRKTYFNKKRVVEIVVKNANQLKSADPVTYDDNGNVIPLSERFNSKNNDIRYSDRREVQSVTEAETKELEKHFGTTGNFKVAGYLLTDGKLLDFSGKHWGDTTSRSRQVDHRDVGEVLNRGNNGVSDMVDMIGSGNIRLMPETGGINLAVYPNEKQRRVLSTYINYMLATEGQVIIDYDSVGGDTVYSKEYGKYASSRQILSDIRSYFNGARQSELMQFHTMYSDRDPDSYSNRSLLAGALETAVQNDIERTKLEQYKQKIDRINSEEQKLRDLRAKIKELSFAKGPRDTEALKNLQFEANQTANRINVYDRQLLDLESTKALKGVLEREKKRAYQKAEQRGEEALEKQREGRYKTAVRLKIKNVVNSLNTYLLKGSKEKHVPIGLQSAVAEALNAVNMDTVGADKRIAEKEKEMMRAKTPEEIEKLVKEVEYIQEMGGNMAAKLERLKTAYDNILNSDDPIVANSYDEVISNTIARVINEVGDTSLRDMNLRQLESVYDMYKMILATVRNTNKAFKLKKSEEISTVANQVIAELDEQKKRDHLQSDTAEALSSFDWNNQKPVYAFERIGSDTFTDVFNSVREGEDVWARDMTEAQAFLEEQKKKYNYKSWDFNKRIPFASSTGKDFSLSLGQIMSLYAYSKRGPQAKEHLKYGGFVFDGITEVKEKGKVRTKTYKLKDSTAYNLSEGIIENIVSKLTEDQKNFADAMQDYLSTVMGEKGNEVSLALYDVKLFKEKHYFPLKSAPQFLERAREQAQGDVKIKNKGFTKETKPKSRNPIVLSDFMDVWAGHVNEMSMYHAFALPLEDFYRVYNYNTPASETLQSDSVISYLENAHGNASVAYIDQLLKDLNGGARSDSRENIFKSGVSNFKKAAVMASLSVVVQQPSAIVRAYALVDARHFVGKKVSKAKQKETWAEVKKYAPVAIIKEMGYFDTGMGKSSVDWLKGEKTWKDKVDDVLSFLPGKADEVTWCAIWNAVKRETAARNPKLSTGSEEFLKLAGERFTEVIVKTQVYDSTLAKSANMRSKNLYMNMLTAFMAEPTTSINMLQDAFRKGGKKRIARAMGAVYGSVLLNSVLVSLVYAGRDDDEDETYIEKYLSRLTTEVVDGVNPLTYLPFVKDIWSIAQGFDVERADMTIIDSFIDSFKQLFTVCGKDTDDMDEDELGDHRKSIVEAILSVVDNGASLLGIPEKNLRREIVGAINFIKTLATESGKMSAGSLGDNIVEDLKDSVPVWGWFPDKSKSDKLYYAIVKGDEKYSDRLKSGYKDQNAVNSALRKALRDNDPRIKEAAKARYNGDIAEYMKIAKEIIAEGNFKQDDVVAAINSAMSAMNKSEESSEASDKAVSLYKVDDYFKAIMGGDSASAYAVKYDLIETSIANGKDRDEAEASFNSSLTSHIREKYETGDITEYEAKNMLSYAGKTAEEADSKIQYWSFKKNYPDYDLSESAVGKYYSDVQPSGISVGVYYDYSKQRAKAQGTDLNGDGKTDSGSVKREVLQIIHSLPISSYQKDVLYRLNGWAESTLYQAPWH